ncbi:4-oxalocrotonate tautomerase family protein [Nocardia sp. NPDC059240]|uniref:tautomerase family protein n=1 Tax=Nocardia sp. NPDC059240 TaxID=3346786 RepID=UPI0036865904
MPFARLTLAAADIADDTRSLLVTEITDLLDKVLLKDAAHAVVQINLTAPDRWFVGGQPLDTAVIGAHLEVSITAGTNTSGEKAEFIERAYWLLARHLRTLPDAVYVALYELDGESYGYNGVTQLARLRHDPIGRD